MTTENTTITGKADPGAKIKVKLEDGTEHVGFANTSGDYSIAIPTQGINKKIRVTQTTARRGESDAEEITVKGGPAPKPVINEMDTDDTKVTGKGVPNSRVFVKIPGKMERYVNVNGNGDWELETGLLDGGQEIIVYQELPDRPNSEEIRRKVKQLPALAVPRIDYVDSSHDRVWGWAEPGAIVNVHVHGVKHENVTADRKW